MLRALYIRTQYRTSEHMQLYKAGLKFAQQVELHIIRRHVVCEPVLI